MWKENMNLLTRIFILPFIGFKMFFNMLLKGALKFLYYSMLYSLSF